MESGSYPTHHRGLTLMGLQSVILISLPFARDWFRERQVTQFCPVRHYWSLLHFWGRVVVWGGGCLHWVFIAACRLFAAAHKLSAKVRESISQTHRKQLTMINRLCRAC